jgi:hypothetical protein
MRKIISTGATLVALLALGGSAALAQGPAQGAAQASEGKSCFYSRNISSWAPAGRDTVNLRVHINDVYQLKLLGDCPNLDWVNSIGLEHRGSSWICTGLDAEIIAPQPGGIAPIRCPVTSIRKLSKEEASALPPKQHP